MKLSKRLEMVASFVNKGSNLADIGTDHGYIPIILVLRGIVGSAIAMDVKTGPLERAANHVRLFHLEDRIETRLSDGVVQLKAGEADSVVIAGMGGDLVVHILEEGRHLWDDVSQWVLSPQSELDKVRGYLKEHGFSITREAMVFEEGKYYTVMDVVRGEMGEMSPAEQLYGRYLIQNKDLVLQSFLEKERIKVSNIIEQIKTQKSKNSQTSQNSEERRVQFEEQLGWIKEAEDEML